MSKSPRWMKAVWSLACAVLVAPTAVLGATAGSSVIIGWDFRNPQVYRPGCGATTLPVAATHDSVGVQGQFFHTASGCDTGAVGGWWWTNFLNTTTNFPYLAFTTTSPITLQELRLKSLENDPTNFSVAVELSPVNSPEPTTSQPGTGYSSLGSFQVNSGAMASNAVTLAAPLTLQPGTYYIRFRPQSSPVVGTAWLALDDVVLVGTVSY
ncbi:hypothetical protein ATI61_101779 [Archangium gephyra]|uniref:Secreted protein n=1 Tax=Archangium gephyra TaxID=48 RepID=A0AAC8TFR8_9BACT|nr:hypothetical protein [Archangium gephyra]AKJ04125.1 Hypothetical protein AA314_05751 [Archangium gephyra]REG37792.1 hypothetical protein ATI61_101779 [Archangium gephyra]